MLVISNTKAVVLAFSSLEELDGVIANLVMLRKYAAESQTPTPPYLYVQSENTTPREEVEAYTDELKTALGRISMLDHAVSRIRALRTG